jgi:HlyD family secretion protein
MTARIITDVRKDVLSIPIIALTTRPEKTTGDTARAVPLGDSAAAGRRKDVEGVFVVENGIARFRPVKVGIAGDEHFELLSGISENETIVAGTYQAIRDMADSTKVRAAANAGGVNTAGGSQ